MVATGSPKPMRVVQRAKLWAMTPYRVRGRLWTASQAALAGEAARGQVVEPHPVLQVADGVLDLGVAAMVGLQIQGVAIPVGDESVIGNCSDLRGSEELAAGGERVEALRSPGAED